MMSTRLPARYPLRGCHPRGALLTLVLLVALVSHPGPLHAQASATAPGNLQATVVAGGVQLSWSAPTENAGSVTGYQVLRRTSGQSGLRVYVSYTGSTDTTYIDKGAAEQGETYTYQVSALAGRTWYTLIGDLSNVAAVTIPGTCPISGGSPVDVPVSQVPIVVTSTVEDYFVLYVVHGAAGETVEYPVLVKRGEAGRTTLEDNLAPLPASRYKVKKYPVNNPADVDGDCIDDLTELADLGAKNPVNPAEPIDISNGAVSIADRAAFQKLSFQGRYTNPWERYLVDLEHIKFTILHPGSERPTVYFQNTERLRGHFKLPEALGFSSAQSPWKGGLRGDIIYHPNVVAPDGSLGVYRYNFRFWEAPAFDSVALAYEALAAAMPVVENNLAYHPFRHALSRYRAEKALYDASRVNVLLEEDIFPDVNFIPLNEGEGYGLLREMELEERPNSRDIVIYETLPNDLPRVAGIITGVPQTPLSHVNLRAVQNGAPNAFIRAPLDAAAIDDLLDRHVYYKVTQSGYTLRAATRAEVDAHYDASRPASAQTPERDLSVTKITPLSEIGFDDWDAFGVKAANMAVLGTLGFPEGTVRDGFAVPFHFYDEFMKNAGLAEETVFGKGKGAAEDRFTLPAGTKLNAVVTAMLAHPKFRKDYEIQDEMLDDLRDAIKDARSPAWIITELEAMHAKFPKGTSLRYRSSTNNEDLPGYNGAGLYSSKTQDPDETEEEGIDKSIKGVWASLWNFRAFVERDFHRIDHARTAMGVLVHPNYSLEKANGVAVSFDPVTNRAGAYYVNTQLGEDLITNPEAHSRPEEILLLPGGRHEVLVRSNLAEPGKLLMSAAQLTQLRSHLEVIHKKFSELYGAAAGEPFAMDIEFKITSLGKLSIKQARPWVFQAQPNRPPTVASAIVDVTIVNESGTREISLNGVFADDDGDSLTVAATSSDENVATVSLSADHATLTVSAQARGTATITVAAADGNGGSVEDSFTVRVRAAPVVASAIEDVTGLEVGSTQDISLSGVFSDADGDALTITAASSDLGVAAVSVAADYSGLTVSGVSEGAATITLAAQDSGTPKPTVNQPGAYEGYTLFYHPKDVKFYLIDNQGRKAFEWSQPFGNHGKLLASGNLLTGNGPVHLTERNPRGIPVWSYGSMPNHHDVLKLSNGNYLFLHEVIYQKVEAVAEGANPECLEKNATVKIDEVVEIKPNGEVVWRWRVWDHLIQDHDPDQANYGTVADHPERIDINYGLCRFDGTDRGPTHLNALDYNAALNQIMITSRHFSEIWIVDRSTTMAEAAGSSGGNGGMGGGLLYRWGNPRAYRQGTKDDQKLFFPHNAHWIPAGLPGAGRVLLYNNGNEHPGFGRGYSSVDEIVLPADGYGYTRPEGSAYGPSGPAWSYRHSDGSLAYWGSGAQRLPNGNTLVVDAPLGRIREVTQSREVVWEYRSTENRGMYRAYKYAPDHPGVRALPLTPEGDRKPAANLVSDTFLVSVIPPNNQPPTVASAIADATIVSESGTHETPLTGVFADADNDGLTVTASSSDENVATVSVSADRSTLTVSAQARGTATVTVSSADGNGGSVEDSFTVRVKAAPVVASAIADVSGLIVGDRRDISLSRVFSDADGDALAITATSSDENVVTVSVTADRSKLTVTGVAVGAATITVTARDADGNSVGDAFEVSVAGAEPPVGPEPWNIWVVPGDGTLTVTWNVGSRAGVAESEIRHAVRWSQKPGVWNNPRDPRAVGRNDGVHVAPGETEYMITGLENGVPAGVFVRSFTGHRNNMSERDQTSSKWVRVKGVHTTPVAPPNAAPTVASAIADATIVSENGTHQVALSGVFTDANGDALAITATSSAGSVATVAVSADHSTLTVAALARGTAAITVAAADGRGGSVEDSFVVTVKAAPVVAAAIEDVSDLIVGDRRDISLSGVFSDADGDALAITAASSDENVVTVSVPADQSKLTVTGVAEGTATITVTARDVDGNSVSDAFDVTAAAVERQVLASAPLTFGDAAVPDAVYTAGAPAVRAPGPDAAGEPEPPRLPEASGGVGKVTYSAAGLPAGLDLGPDRVIRGAPQAATASPARVTYSATDEAGESVSLTFQVTVNPAVAFSDAELSRFTNDIIEYTVGQDADLHFVFPEASGGTGSLTYHLDNREPDVAIDDYAAGLTFDPITRTLSSGTGEDQPVAGQRYALTYRAEDERGSRAVAYGSIEVNEAPSLPETADRSFTAGDAVSVTLPAATGGSAKIVRLRYSLEPQIPGLSFDSGTRKLSGTPTATGATAMTYTVMDRNGVTGTATFTITVAAGAGAPASAPGSVRAAQAPGLKTFGMSWAEVTGATGYVVQVAAEGSGFPTDSAASSGPAGASVSVHQCCSRAVVDVAEYGNYQARVAAVNAEGAGPWSAATLVAVAEPPPPQPEPVRTYALTPAVRVVEGDYYSLELTLSDPVPAPYATFKVSIGYGSANAEDVHSGAVSTFTLGAGATSWSFSVPTRDDAVDEDDETFTVVVAPTYIKGKWEKAGDGRDTATVTIADDDTAGITVTAANPLAAAEGGNATYTVVLDSQPTANVTVTPGSSDGGAVTVAPASHTFTPSDWHRAATFTVSAVADDDGDDENAVVSHQVSSQDTKYAAVPAPSVSVAVSDTTPANNPPTVASAIDDATIVNESGARGATLSGVFSDADGDALTITAASSDESVSTVSVASDQSRLTVTAKARGTATITVTASDGNGGSVSDSFTVTVKAAPMVAAAIDDVNELYIDATHEVDLTGVPSDADEEVLTDVFTDADGDALTITAESSDTEVLEVATVVDETTKMVTGLTVTGVAEGTATVTVTAEDADGNRVSDAFDVTVTENTDSQFYDGQAVPGPVTDLQLTAEGVSLIVSWGAPAPDSGGEVRGYIVHLKPEDGGKGRTKTPKAKKTKVSFDNLEAGRTYQVWVRAENEAGKGERVRASITLPEAEPPPEPGDQGEQGDGQQQDGQSGQ